MIEQAVKCSEIVYTKFRKLIVTKGILPGEPICQIKLSQLLNTNIDCLNEAVNKLCKESFVTLNSSKNIMIREVSTKEIIDILDCRIALETKAIKLFTLRAPQARIDDLRNLMVPFEKGPQNGYVFHKIYRIFHELIVINCGNDLLIKLFNQSNFWPTLELIGFTRPLMEILQEHLDLVSAVHNRDANKAAELMQEHFEHCRLSVL
ncbi:GntR family transcriptional regulator [Maribacter flavus]|uniref:GntR family transcriptional regulator n=2 Tax=Maribacter flavus TaxID=1658664 RepID=A0A5B2TYU4_9FLAO|nr:GntR family transcriptional regulator [Maribacter flavus]